MPRSDRSSLSSVRSRHKHVCRHRSASSDSTRSSRAASLDVHVLLSRFDDLQRELSPLVAWIQGLQQDNLEFQGRLQTLESKVEQLVSSTSIAKPSADEDQPMDGDYSSRKRGWSHQPSVRGRRVSFAEPASQTSTRSASSPPTTLAFGSRLVISGFKTSHDNDEFKVILKQLFPDLPDVRITTRKLFDDKVRVDFDSNVSAKAFKSKYVPLKPKHEEQPIYINWILSKDVAQDAFIGRCAKRFLSSQLGADTNVRLCSFTHTIFVNRQEACFGKQGKIIRCSKWPSAADFSALEADILNHISRG